MINSQEIFSCKMKKEENVMKIKLGCNKNKKRFKDSKQKWKPKEKFNRKKEGKKESIYKKCFQKMKKTNKSKKKSKSLRGQRT